MATRNHETGLYEARKKFVSTGQEVAGTGASKEEAKADLRKKLEPLRIDYSLGLAPGLTEQGRKEELARIERLVNSGKLPRYAPETMETGETFGSPGFAVVRDGEGKVSYRFAGERQGLVSARPDVAKWRLRQARERAEAENKKEEG